MNTLQNRVKLVDKARRWARTFSNFGSKLVFTAEVLRGLRQDLLSFQLKLYLRVLVGPTCILAEVCQGLLHRLIRVATGLY